MVTPQDLEALRITPLAESEAKAKQNLDGHKKPEKERDAVPEEHDFNLDFRAPSGRVYQGHFTTHVLTIRERKVVGAMRAQQAGNAALDALTPDVSNLIFMSTWCHVALKKRPEWANDLDSLVDVSVLEKIWIEVASHERSFFGAEQPDEAGQTAS